MDNCNNLRGYFYTFLFVLSFLVLWGCNQSQNQAEKPKEQTIHSKTVQYQVETIATIGIDEAQKEEDEPYQFASVSSVDCDSKGNIYVLDVKAKCVKVFNQDGKFVREMFRAGKGPKEISNPVSIRINRFSGTIFLLNEYGYKMKEFDLEGNFLRLINLPEQFINQFGFASKDVLVYIALPKPGTTSYYNFKKLDLKSGKIIASFAKFNSSERDNSFSNIQRFIINDGFLWTSPINNMEVFSYNLKTGERKNRYTIPGVFKKNEIKIASYKGAGMLAVLGYNFAQPVLLDCGIFFILTQREYNLKKKPKWKGMVFPESSRLSLMSLSNDGIQKVFYLKGCDQMYPETAFKNRIILAVQDPYNYIKILEVKSLE